MPRLRFTDRTIKALKPPISGSQDYWDRTQKNFGLRITPTGRRTFFVFYRHFRIKHRLTLGPYPLVSLRQARESAIETLGQVASGLNPAREKLLAKRSALFQQLASEYLEKHAKKRKRSWPLDARMLKANVLPVWKSLPVSDISRADVRALIEPIAERGAPILANRVLALVSKIFNFAIEQDWPLDNPCVRVRRPGIETKRRRVLSRDEIKRVWEALEHEEPFFRAFYQLRLLTAQRGGEVRQMRWEDVDFERAIWTIPSAVAKNKKEHRVPLNEQALNVLSALQTSQSQRLAQINEGRQKKGWDSRTASEFVFPNPQGDGPIQWVQRVTNRVRARSGVDFRPHDLRGTAATYMQAAKVPLITISRILNHSPKGVTDEYYAHYDFQKEATAALRRWGNDVERIVSGASGDVVAMPRKRAQGVAQKTA